MSCSTKPYPPAITKEPRLSLWTAHKSPLAHYKSTPELPSHADVVIIGSGFSGASVAHHLTEQHSQLNVVMLEAREACSGASGRNGGHLAPNYLSPEIEFEKLNYQALYDLISSSTDGNLAKDCFIHKDREQTGWFVFESQHDFDDAKDKLSRLARDHGIVDSRLRVLGPELTRQELGLSSHWPVCGAISNPTTPINPYKLTTWLLSKSVERGLKLYTDTLVTSVDSGQVTTHGGVSITADKVILATNAYTGALSAQLCPQLTPMRGQVARWEVARDKLKCARDADGKLSMGVLDEYFALVPVEGDETKVSVVYGGLRRYTATQEVGLVDDNVISPVISRGLKEKLKTMFGIEDEPVEEWTGIMGFTPDYNPVIGRLDNGVLSMAGFSGHGMPRIFLCGRALVERYFGAAQKWPEWFPDVYKVKNSAKL